MENQHNIPAADDLILQIQFAFDSVRLEDGVSWHQADALDQYRGDGVAERALDDYEHWKGMPYGDLDDGSNSPGFLDAKGLRFYLPAYMLSVLHGRQFRFNTAEHFLWRLGNRQTVAELKPLLNKKQEEVISHFLSFVAEASEPDSETRNALDCWNEVESISVHPRSPATNE